MLSADFLHLAEDVEMVNDNADIFHLDIMDGVLVPNLSYGFPVVEAIAGMARKPMDVHLMIVEPYRYIERFAKTGAAMISFHLEAARKAGKDAGEILDMIRSLGVRAGLAINPDIEVDGGVSPSNAAALAAAGAGILVAGSSVFKAHDPAGAIRLMRG